MRWFLSAQQVAEVVDPLRRDRAGLDDPVPQSQVRRYSFLQLSGVIDEVDLVDADDGQQGRLRWAAMMHRSTSSGQKNGSRHDDTIRSCSAFRGR